MSFQPSSGLSVAALDRSCSLCAEAAQGGGNCMELFAQTEPETNNSVRFLGIDLEIHGDVLRPRMETELLGRAARQLLDEIETAPVCVDVCCGSGNLAIALAMHRADACVWACDLSDDAI